MIRRVKKIFQKRSLASMRDGWALYFKPMPLVIGVDQTAIGALIVG